MTYPAKWRTPNWSLLPAPPKYVINFVDKNISGIMDIAVQQRTSRAISQFRFARQMFTLPSDPVDKLVYFVHCNREWEGLVTR